MQELFEVKLNHEGKRFLKRLHSWAVFLFICTVITCVLDLATAYLSYRTFVRLSDTYPSILKFHALFNIIFLMMYAILLPVQASYFLRFSTDVNKAIQFEDETGFNQSFRWLFKQVVLASVLFAANCLWAIFYTYAEIKLLALYETI